MKVKHDKQWGGLRVAGLCIGVDEYKHAGPLRNAGSDAEEFSKTLSAAPGCYSGVVQPQDHDCSLKDCENLLGRQRVAQHAPPALCAVLCGAWDPAW
jgi:hypothetical protein